MTLNEYQQAAQRTASTKTTDDKILNGIMGMCGEIGEVADILKKYLFQGHEFDREKMIKECGYVIWYVAELAAGLGMTLEDLYQLNVDKLRRRYPDGFDPERSMHREEGDI